MKGKLLMWMFVMLMLVTTSFASSSLEDTAVLYYSFDTDDVSGETMTDISSNSEDGTCIGMTNCNTVTGLVKQATDFDGSDDFINVTGNLNVDFSGHSINFWVKPETYSSLDQYFFFRKDDDNYIRFTHDGSDSLQLTIKTLTTPDTNAYTINDGVWTMITLIDKGSATDVLINGINQTQMSVGLPSLDSGDKTLGAYYDGSINRFDGQLDELSIYNKSLISSETNALYNGGSGRGFKTYDEYFVLDLTSRYYLNDTAYDGVGDIEDTWGTNNGQGFGKTFYDGTVTGATLNSSCGLTNMSQCYTFDGSGDYITTPDGGFFPNSNFGNQHSISFWMRPNVIDTGNSLQTIVQSNQGGVELIAVNYRTDGRVCLNYFSGFSGGCASKGFSSDVLNSDQWYHIGMTWEVGIDDSLILYVDGIDQTDPSFGGVTWITANPILIGEEPPPIVPT